jgi:hypothetical protein
MYEGAGFSYVFRRGNFGGVDAFGCGHDHMFSANTCPGFNLCGDGWYGNGDGDGCGFVAGTYLNEVGRGQISAAGDGERGDTIGGGLGVGYGTF